MLLILHSVQNNSNVRSHRMIYISAVQINSKIPFSNADKLILYSSYTTTTSVSTVWRPYNVFIYFFIRIKHGFSCINSRQAPTEVLKTEAGGRGFQHLPRDLANVNALQNHVRSLLLHKTENICYISRYFLHYFVSPFHRCLSNAIATDYARSRAMQYTSRNGSKSVALLRSY